MFVRTNIYREVFEFDPSRKHQIYPTPLAKAGSVVITLTQAEAVELERAAAVYSDRRLMALSVALRDEREKVKKECT